MPNRFLVFALLAAASACAGRARPAPQPLRLTWQGNLQPTRQRTARAAVEQINRVFGTVVLMEASDDPNRTRAQITMNSSPLQPGATIGWAVAPGRCGSGTLPLMVVTNFPPIDVGRGGRGQLDTEFALTLPADGTLHVNVYWGYKATNALNDVMTCANLKRQTRSPSDKSASTTSRPRAPAPSATPADRDASA